VPRNSHILNAASNLLGIALLIVTGINITNNAGKTYADEAGLTAAVLLAVSCLVSYLSIRRGDDGDRLEAWADKVFIAGLLALLAAVGVLVLSPF
jgi:hypothetical protein